MVDWSPAPYGTVEDANQARRIRTAHPYVPANDEDAAPVPREWPEPQPEQQYHPGPSQHIGAGQQHFGNGVVRNGAATPIQPPTFAAAGSVLDAAFGNFFPRAASTSSARHSFATNVPPAPGYLPADEQQRSESFRSLAPPGRRFISYVPRPSAGEEGSSSVPPATVSSRAAGKQGIFERVEQPPDPEQSSSFPTGRPKKYKKRAGEVLPALSCQTAPDTWRKADGIREPAPPIKPSGMYYDSFAEAQSKMNHPDWTSPAEDDIPKTPTELMPWVVQLVDAMKDLSKMKDKTSNHSVQKRWLKNDASGKWSGQTLVNEFYMPHVLEWLAWKIATAIQQLHLNGPGTVECQDPLVLENSFEDKDLTFAQRMEIFIKVCRERKSRIQLMLDSGMLERYILTPSTILQGSEYNDRANARRAGMIKEGHDTWLANNPDKAPGKKATAVSGKSKSSRTRSNRGGSVARGGRRSENRTRRQSARNDAEKSQSDDESDGSAEDVVANLEMAEQAATGGARPELDEAGFQRPASEQDFDEDMGSGFDDDDDAPFRPSAASDAGSDSDDSGKPSFSDLTTTAIITLARKSDARSAANKRAARTTQGGDTRSAVAKGKRKARPEDDGDASRPKKKSARRASSPRDSESTSPVARRRRHNNGGDDDVDDDEEEFREPYVGKGKGKAPAKRGREDGDDPG